ncbi:unnamed protein product [Paramecium sonneborni]|uniref:Transmembrane protein n=1 Tax=Paramecium sonneborni TaxID=65129 RepID=A0A8S1QX92_9CILI|nr:unnamed protein product [Paramecium sonneborni]
MFGFLFSILTFLPLQIISTLLCILIYIFLNIILQEFLFAYQHLNLCSALDMLFTSIDFTYILNKIIIKIRLIFITILPKTTFTNLILFQFRAKNPVVSFLPKFLDWLESQLGKSCSERTYLQTIEGYLKNILKLKNSIRIANLSYHLFLYKRNRIKDREYTTGIQSTTINQTLNEQQLKHQILLYDDEIRVLNKQLNNIYFISFLKFLFYYKGGNQLQESLQEEKEILLKKSKELILNPIQVVFIRKKKIFQAQLKLKIQKLKN